MLFQPSLNHYEVETKCENLWFSFLGHLVGIDLSVFVFTMIICKVVGPSQVGFSHTGLLNCQLIFF